MPQSGSSLASVVGSRPDDLDKWTSRLLLSRNALAQLHIKFWGKSMADEERDWRAKEPIANGNRGNVQSDVGQDEGVDVGGDESTNEDSDVIPGCYTLDLGIPEITQRRIWIRV